MTPLSLQTRRGVWALVRAFLGLIGALPTLAGAQTEIALVDLQVVVQPIIVLDDGGGNAPRLRADWFEAPTDRIWSQAGIDIQFLEPRELRSTRYQALETTAEIDRLFADSEAGANADPLILNMWIVRSVSGAFGRALTGRNGIVIGEIVFTYRDGRGRIDTIAHEIGHNLGLDHTIFGASGSGNLMTASGRESPTSLCEIHPTGSRTDRLNAVQIAVSRASKFARPITPTELEGRDVSVELRLDREGVLRILNTDCGCYSIETSTTLGLEDEWILWKTALEPELGSVAVLFSEHWNGSGFFRATPDLVRVIQRP